MVWFLGLGQALHATYLRTSLLTVTVAGYPALLPSLNVSVINCREGILLGSCEFLAWTARTPFLDRRRGWVPRAMMLMRLSIRAHAAGACGSYRGSMLRPESWSRLQVRVLSG
jgi:hypothetical protein